jgi:acyl carrier protein
MSITANQEKLREIFREVLSIEPELINDELQYTQHRWDSVAHLAIVSRIENAFDVFLETDQVVDMSSFAKAKEILRLHGVDV